MEEASTNGVVPSVKGSPIHPGGDNRRLALVGRFWLRPDAIRGCQSCPHSMALSHVIRDRSPIVAKWRVCRAQPPQPQIAPSASAEIYPCPGSRLSNSAFWLVAQDVIQSVIRIAQWRYERLDSTTKPKPHCGKIREATIATPRRVSVEGAFAYPPGPRSSRS